MSSFEPFDKSSQISEDKLNATITSRIKPADYSQSQQECATTFNGTAAMGNVDSSAAQTSALTDTTSEGTTSPLKASGLLLTVQQAASILGKSVRALERSLIGRWGNKLPEGWTARKIQGENGDEWRVVPPAGFKLPASLAQVDSSDNVDFFSALTQDFLTEMKSTPKRSLQRSESHAKQATIVIDRSNDVEYLLRELLATQKALAEERRLHMEDLRMVAQLQGHMRLLESNSNDTARVKLELEQKQRELEQLKDEYNQIQALPWWKKIFAFSAKKN